MAVAARGWQRFSFRTASVSVRTMHQHSDPTKTNLFGTCQRSEMPCGMCKQMADLRVVHADELLQGHREVFIVHAGQIYRLLRTRNDKLILQK